MDDYWQHEMTCVQEFWEHNDYFSWLPEAYDQHVHNLADTRCSTKGSLEDMIGRLKDRSSRDGMADDFQCHERIFFHHTQLQKRVDETEFPVLGVRKEELLDKNKRRARQGRWYFDDRLANSTKKADWLSTETLRTLRAVSKSNAALCNLKPCSMEADCKSIAAAMVFNKLGSCSFEKIENGWATAFLQEGFLFQEKMTGVLYVSMRCHGNAAWAFQTEIDAYPENKDVFLVLDPKITYEQSLGRVKELVVTDLSAPVEDSHSSCEQFVAIPTTISFYLN